MGVTEEAWYELGRAVVRAVMLNLEEGRNETDLGITFARGLMDEAKTWEKNRK